MVATFNPGSAIRARDLNDNFEQLQSALQELNELNDNLGNIRNIITEPMQTAGQWVVGDDKLASSDAITARHDAYIGDTKPAEPAHEQLGKIGKTLMVLYHLLE